MQHMRQQSVHMPMYRPNHYAIVRSCSYLLGGYLGMTSQSQAIYFFFWHWSLILGYAQYKGVSFISEGGEDGDNQLLSPCGPSIGENTIDCIGIVIYAGTAAGSR